MIHGIDKKETDVENRLDWKGTAVAGCLSAARKNAAALVSPLLLAVVIITGCATSPLQQKTMDGDVNGVLDLLNQGANINEASGPNGKTALIIAAERGRTELVKLFLEKGANIEAESTPCLMGCAGITSLGWAAYNGHTQTVLFLYEKGADIDRAIVGLEAYSRVDFGFGFDHTLLRSQTSYGIKLLQRLGTDRGSIKAAAVKSIPVIRSGSASLIAVIDFKADGVSYQEARKVSEWLRTELINTGQFQVIERSAMDAILKEQAFSMTGCTDTSCAVQMGRLLSARKMLVGSVEVWKNKVFINGRIIDVEKGVAEFAHKETVASVNDLDAGTANFAKNLARRINGLPVE